MELKTLKDVIKFVNDYWIRLKFYDGNYQWKAWKTYMENQLNDNTTSTGDY